MARRRKQASDDPPQPSDDYHLLVGRAEFRIRLAEELSKLDELSRRLDTIATEEELDDFQSDRSIWSKRVSEYLRRKVSNPYLQQEFDYYGGGIYTLNSSLWNLIQDERSTVSTKRTRLKAIIGRLDDIDCPIDDDQTPTAGTASHPSASASPDAQVDESSNQSVSVDNSKVFIVHGHDDAARETVARTIEKLGLEAVILNEQANEGKTIIEKFEAHSSPGFAAILLTPDDIGGEDEDSIQPRARQNVILELGFFMGKLGRDRVLALVKGGIEIPSDISGLVYEPMDEAGHWKYRLGKEMRSAGLEVDLNKL